MSRRLDEGRLQRGPVASADRTGDSANVASNDRIRRRSGMGGHHRPRRLVMQGSGCGGEPRERARRDFRAGGIAVGGSTRLAARPLRSRPMTPYRAPLGPGRPPTSSFDAGLAAGAGARLSATLPHRHGTDRRPPTADRGHGAALIENRHSRGAVGSGHRASTLSVDSDPRRRPADVASGGSLPRSAASANAD